MIVKQRKTFTGEEADVTLVGNVYHVTRWKKLAEERLQRILEEQHQKRPVTVPRSDSPPKQLAPDGDPEFFIAVRPPDERKDGYQNGHPNSKLPAEAEGNKEKVAWEIGRIPWVMDEDLNIKAIGQAHEQRWTVIGKRTSSDAPVPIFIPTRFRKALSTREMKDEALQRCAEIARELNFETSDVIDNLLEAEVDLRPSVLDKKEGD